MSSIVNLLLQVCRNFHAKEEKEEERKTTTTTTTTTTTRKGVSCSLSQLLVVNYLIFRISIEV